MWAALTLLVLLGAQGAFADPPADREARLGDLLGTVKGAAPGESARVFVSPEKYVRFLGAPSSTHFPTDAGEKAAPAQNAAAFLNKWRELFVDKAAASVRFEQDRTRTQGTRSSVRFRQTVSGLPVFGAAAVVQVNSSGGVACVATDLMRDTQALDSGKVSPRPGIAKAKACERAVLWLSSEHKGLKMEATEPVLMLYDPSVVGLKGAVRLVWRTEVGNVGAPEVKEVALVDAHNGEIAFHYPLIYDAKFRNIYDDDAGGALARSEGQPPTGIVDVDMAYDHLGETYDFYLNEHGRDSIDNAGMTLNATVRMAMQNAYWSGSAMFFGDGFAVDDVTAHELTHGVTQYESGLIYSYQSGAINESLSDMWGEWIDLTYTTPDPGERWLCGEDLPIGAIRNLANPPAFGDPDRMGSPLWYTGSGDYGGVHTNSGVGNKLCYLLTDGDTFNGQTVTGMGISRAADLMYECQANLLFPSAEYYDLYYTLTQAAINLGFTQDERDNVERACLAVEIKPLSEGVSNFRAVSSAGDPNITLSWTNPTQAGLVSIIIRRSSVAYPASPTDGDPVYEGLGTSTVDGPLTIGTRYYYSAWAFYGGTDYSAADNAETVAGEDTPDYFTEIFESGDNDLDNHSLLLVPNGSPNFYAAYCDPALAFPTDPAGGTLLSLGDDSYTQVTLGGGAQVSLYGSSYPSFFVGSNGYITFTVGDTDLTESLVNHFDTPRISALFDDLHPGAGGSVSWRQLADRAAVTFQNVPEYGTGNANSFQVEMFFDGKIRITWLAIAATDGLAGISEGLGVPSDFIESDLTAYPPAPVDNLLIVPSTGLVSSGYEGGPFTPGDCVYTLSNTSGAPLDWTGVPSDSWITLAPTSGTLAPAGEVDVTVAINETVAGALSPGNYSGSVAFTNVTSDTVQTRTVRLTITALPDPPPAPSNPNPADGATSVPVDSLLSWNGAGLRLARSIPGDVSASLASIISRSGILQGPVRIDGARGNRASGSVVEGTITLTKPEEIARVLTAIEKGIRTASLLNVAICGADDPPYNGDVQSKLLGTGQFNSVSIIDVRSVTPTLGELQAFDAVLVYSDYPYADATALGNVMADYVDAGGGVVCAEFEASDYGTAYYMQGRWLAEEYGVLVHSSPFGLQATLGVVHVPGHPTMEGVSTFDCGSGGFRPTSSALFPGGTLIAGLSDGGPLVAVKEIGGVRRVDLGFYPPSSDVASYFWLSSTDGDLLMANALAWTTGGGAAGTTYAVYFGESGSPMSLITTTTLTNCEPVPYPMDYSTTYTWQVIATNVAGSTPGPIWSFTTRQAPGEIEVTDSIPPADDLAMPFGDVFLGSSRTEQITVTNSDPSNPLVVSNIGLGGGYTEDFDDGLAQGWDEDVDAHWEVVAGEYRAESPTMDFMTATYGGRTWDDLSAEITCRRTGSDACSAAVVLRASADFDGDGTGSGYVFQIATNGSYGVWKQVGGSFSWLQSWTSSSAILPGDNTLQASAEGSALKFFVNGSLVWSGSDADLTGGCIGLAGYTEPGYDATHYFDNVAVGSPTIASASINAEQQWYNAHSFKGGTPKSAPAKWDVPPYTGQTGRAAVITPRALSPQFRLENLPAFPVTLAPGQSLVFDVIYEPTAVGTQTASVLIESDDADEPEVTVALSGTGVDPIVITHTPLTDTTDPGPYTVQADIVTVLGLSDATLVHSINGGATWTSQTMTNTGGSTYAADIPGQPIGTQVWYYIHAGDVGAHEETHPAGAPAAHHAFLVKGIPNLVVAPTALSFIQPPETVTTQSVVLANTGTWPAEWSVFERPSQTLTVKRTLAAYKPAESRPAVNWNVEHNPAILLVGFRASATFAARESVHAALGTAKVYSYHRIPVDVVKVPAGSDLKTVAAAYAARPEVAYAEPNYTLRAYLTPNDPQYPNMWALNNTGQTGGTPDADIDAPEAWDLQTGSQSVVVAVIDTGCDYTHPELAPNLWTNEAELNGTPGVDDDGNGIVDDIYGARWTSGSGVPTSGNPMDGHGHGTHVSGTIGAAGNNGAGVTGVNWSVRLMGLKFLSDAGSGSVADAVSALEYAIDKGACLSSNSWGGGGYSQALKDMIDAAGAAGQLFVAAAGNDSKDTDLSPQYPSCYDSSNIISVASSDHNDARSWFSNWGATTVDLAAPGSSILSTWTGGGYNTISGTSMATPHVSGVAALLLASVPGTGPLEIKQAILNGTDPLSWGGYQTVTNGRLNAEKALKLAGIAWLDEAPLKSGVLDAGTSITILVSANTTGLPDGYGDSGQLVFTGDPDGDTTVTVDLEVHSYVRIVHTPLGDTNDQVGPYQVIADITADAGLDTSELWVYYSTDGGLNFDRAAMASSGGDTYTGEIPGQSWRTTPVLYYISAKDTLDRAATHPATAPGATHSFRVGYPELRVDVHVPLHQYLYPEQVTTFTAALTLTNVGYGDLNWSRTIQPTAQLLGNTGRSDKPGIYAAEHADECDARNQPRRAGIQAKTLSAGDVLASWSVGHFPWGISYDGNNGTVWVCSPAAGWGGDSTVYEFTPGGIPTGRTHPLIFGPTSGPGDFAYNWNTGKLWAMGIAPDRAIHEMDPATGFTGTVIDPGFGISQRGLAYDPVTDTFYAGGWNDLTIYQFDTSGAILRSVFVGLPIAGLAYNPDTNHLFVMTNNDPNLVYVLDAGAGFAVLGSFPVPGFGAYSGAGLEFQSDGSLWAVNQADGFAYLIDSGESANLGHQWLKIEPKSGPPPLPSGGSVSLTATFDAGGLVDGDYRSANLVIQNLSYPSDSFVTSASLTVGSDDLGVMPPTGFTSSGPWGGPFSPASKDYTLINVGTAPIPWSVDDLPGWLDASPPSGTLLPTESVVVTISINETAAALPPAPDPYGDSFLFHNHLSESVQTTTATLQVRGVAAFGWDEVTSPRYVSVPFPATIRAIDETGMTVRGFDGTTTLTAWSGGGFLDKMEAGVGSWTATGLWHLVGPGSPYPEAHTPTHSWWYGQDSTGDYDTAGSSNSGNLISPSFVVPSGSNNLTFWSWEQTEGDAPVYDTRKVYITTDGGVTWTPLFQSLDNTATWHEVGPIDLSSFAGQTAQLRFEFDTVDGVLNTFRGWYVDDLQVGERSPVAFSYTTNSFSQGVCMTNITIPQEVGDVRLGAQDGSGHFGQSNPFDVVPPPVFTLTYIAGPNGSISGTTPQTVTYGDSGTAVTAVADTGYHFVKWSDNMMTASRTDTNVTGDLLTTATFAINQYTVTFQTDGTPGATLDGPTSQTIAHGSDCAPVTANAPVGRHFVNWTVKGSDYSTSNPLTLTNVTTDALVTANFAINTYRVAFQTDGTLGATLDGVMTQTVLHGDNCTSVTANAPVSHRFVKWTVNGSDYSTSNPLTVTNVTTDTLVTANFEIKTYTVTFQTDGKPGVTLDGATSQTIAHGSNCTPVTANAPEIYRFVQWTKGGKFYSTDNPLTVTVVIEDMTFTADFTPSEPAAVKDWPLYE